MMVAAGCIAVALVIVFVLGHALGRKLGEETTLLQIESDLQAEAHVRIERKEHAAAVALLEFAENLGWDPREPPVWMAEAVR